MFPGEGSTWSLEWLQIQSELGCESTGEQTLQDLVRIKQFKAHDLTHVCCQRGWLSEVEDDDIDEILDEQSHEIQELEEIMDRYSEGPQGNLEERWIEQLALNATQDGKNLRETRSRLIKEGDTASTDVS